MPETHDTPDLQAGDAYPRRAALTRGLVRTLVAISHHSLAAVGLAVAAALLLGWSQPGWRAMVETHTLGWLQGRQEARAEPRSNEEVAEVSEALTRATASEPSSLTGEQAAVAAWLARRYRIALEPVSRLVLEAWSIGPRAGLEPTLILAVAAVESAFNPFAQGSAGAKGLMQVVAHAHLEKFEPLGGLRAAFDPVSNLRVGALVLKESIAEAGSVEGGLLAYVGANSTSQQPGYPQRVLGEQSQLQKAAQKAQKSLEKAPADKSQTLAQAPRDAPIH
ncbi:MAG: transglycosylase SLT domain-containing protein [Betaproteobacteria bacterium]